MSDTPPNPPKGEAEKAEKYINQLCSLIDQDKLSASKTDLSKYDPGAFQDHYRVDVKDYQIEISHSMTNDSRNSYVMLFTNLKNVAEGSCEKVILAYVYLNEEQFRKFKEIADDQVNRNKRKEEDKRFAAALTGLDTALNEVGGSSHIPSTNVASETTLSSLATSAPPATVTAETTEEEKNDDESETKSEELTQTNSASLPEDSTYPFRPAQA